MLYTNKIRSGLVATVLISAAMLFCCSITVLAQSATGGIRGIVTDATGATLPNATVIAKNLATGVELKTTTTGEGAIQLRVFCPEFTRSWWKRRASRSPK